MPHWLFTNQWSGLAKFVQILTRNVEFPGASIIPHGISSFLTCPGQEGSWVWGLGWESGQGFSPEAGGTAPQNPTPDTPQPCPTQAVGFRRSESQEKSQIPTAFCPTLAILLHPNYHNTSKPLEGRHFSESQILLPLLAPPEVTAVPTKGKESARATFPTLNR